MKKCIFYPNSSIQGEITTEEEYRNSLVKFYQQKYQSVDTDISAITSFVLYRAIGGVGPGYFKNASDLSDSVKKVTVFERDRIIEICKQNHLSNSFLILCVFYKDFPGDIKSELEEKKIPYSNEIAAITQEITRKIIDDIGATTRSQLTFVEKYTEKPGEKKVQWANRVYNSSAENLIAKKDANPTKSVQFGSDKPIRAC